MASGVDVDGRSSMNLDNRNNTYYVVVTRRGEGANPFGWEIQRRRTAMGVKVSGAGFRSYRDAQTAGSEALKAFLTDLANENRADR
jgi:hypothetical protein